MRFNILIARDQERVAGEEPNAASIAWSKKQFALLAENGAWAIPRSGMIFTRRGNKLVLTSRMPYQEEMPISAEKLADQQRREYLLCKRHFAAAGIQIEDETGVEHLVEEDNQ